MSARAPSPVSRLARLISALLALVLAWCAGLVWFALALPAPARPPGGKVPAILVLTGGSARIAAGFDMLARGEAPRMFISGVYRGVEVAELMARVRAELPDPECCVTLGAEAANTAGNAAESARWVRQGGYDRVRLVTSTYHMPRAWLEFRIALPDIAIEPWPVAPEGLEPADWWRDSRAFRLVAGEYSKYLVSGLRFGLHRLVGG